MINKIGQDDEKLQKQFRPYTPLPNQIQIKDRPLEKYKPSQYIAKSSQEMVINCIFELRKIEDKAGLEVGYRQDDLKDFDKVRETRYYSSSSSSSMSRSSSSSSDSRSKRKSKQGRNRSPERSKSSKNLDKYSNLDDKWHSKLLESRK